MFPLLPKKSLRRPGRSKVSQSTKRLPPRCAVEQLEARVVPSTLEALKTVYAPGEIAVLHLTGLAAGETAAFQVTRTDSGTGTAHVSPTWLATDGGVGDFDHTANGEITAYYRVPSDVNLATFQITATGTSSRSTAALTITGDSKSDDILESEPAPPQTTTTVSSSTPAPASGQAVTFTATVASDRVVNSGEVQFLVDGFDFGDPVPVVNGHAVSGAISSLTVASHTVTATFDDSSGSFDASEGSSTQLVTGGAVQDYTLAWVEVQPHDVAPGQFATVLAGAFQAGETVDFQITNLTNGNTYAPFSVTDGGSIDLDGTTDGHVETTWQVPADALNCQLQISATGETSGLTALATFTDAQLATTTTLASSATTSTYGSSVTFTATVTASSTVNTGAVTFLDGATTLATVNVNASGKATFATAALTAGPHTVTANYTDGTSFANSSGSLTQTVNQFQLWVTANSVSKAEGTALSFAGTEFTLAGAAGVRRPLLFNGDTLTSVSLTSAGAAATAEDGSYANVASAAVGTGLSNYAITYVPGTLTVLEPAIHVIGTALTAINEGDASAPVEVATFTHAGGIEAPGHFTATMDWGVTGHHADAGTVTEDGGGTYHVSAPRPVIAEQGTNNVSVSVSENDAAPAIGQNFAGLSANDDIAVLGGFFVPPDQGSAVGPNHYVEMVNLVYAIYNKDGSVAVPATSLNTFYANAGVTGLGTAISDPRIVYDQASQRWFAVIITTESNSNSIVVAVSQTSDPTGAWKAARFVANSTPFNFADYPTIAVDQNALYIASNNFQGTSPTSGASFAGVSLTSIPKADLLNPAGPVVANRTHFENVANGGTAGTTPFTLAPVSDFDGRGHGVILATDGFTPASVLHVYDVTGSGGAGATLSADSPIAVPTYWNNQNGHEPDGSRTLNSTDFRIGSNNVYQVGNIIWAADSILTSPATGAAAYDAIRWYEIDESTNTLLQSGTISDPHHDYLFPSIAANAAGDVVIGCTATGDSTTSDYPGSWYVTGTTTGGVTTFGTPQVLRNGSSNYSIVASGRNRWGDFSAVSVDPNNPNAFWIADEAAVPGNPAFTTRTQVWGTQMSELVFGTTASAGSSLTVGEPTISGASATLAAVVTGQPSATVEVATFTHANGVEPATDFAAAVDWGVAGHHADAATVSEDSGGTYHVSALRPVFNAGTYTVTVSISEDNASTTVTVMQVVNKDATTTTVTASPGATSFGQSVTFTATVTANAPGSGTPTGTATFYDATFGNTLGTVNLSGGQASVSSSTLAVGTHTITVSYGGDANFLTSQGSTTVSIVSAAYVLNPTLSGSLSLSGNGVMQVPSLVMVDSSSNTALSGSGNAALTAGSIRIVGGFAWTSTGTLSPAPVTHASSVPDPYAALPVPAGGASMQAVSLSSGTKTISPGVYPSITVTQTGSLILKPGVYVIKGGGLTVNGQASITVASGFDPVTGHGVLIYNAGSNFPGTGGNFGGITLSGQGVINLLPPDQGVYGGVVVFQSRDNARALSLSGQGLGLLNTGSIYAKAALLTISGGAKLQDAVVVDRLQLSGNGSSTLVADGSVGTDNNVGELVAGNEALYVSDPAGYLSPDALARIDDAVATWDALLAPYSVTITETNDPATANLVLDVANTSACGGMAQGVLGCYGSGEIVIIQGWNFYAGTDRSAIGVNQYDFETLLFHELGHSLGLGGSSDTNSVMFESLPTGVARRTPTVADLNVGDLDGRPDALYAAGTPALPGVAAEVPAGNQAGTGQAARAGRETAPADRGNGRSFTDFASVSLAESAGPGGNASPTALSFAATIGRADARLTTFAAAGLGLAERAVMGAGSVQGAVNDAAPDGDPDGPVPAWPSYDDSAAPDAVPPDAPVGEVVRAVARAAGSVSGRGAAALDALFETWADRDGGPAVHRGDARPGEESTALGWNEGIADASVSASALSALFGIEAAPPVGRARYGDDTAAFPRAGAQPAGGALRSIVAAVGVATLARGERGGTGAGRSSRKHLPTNSGAPPVA
jgi:hypothetical protein